MSYKICSIDGCEKPMKARTWCAMHYWRNSKHGSPTASGVYARSGEERLAMNTARDPETGCLLWTGAKQGPPGRDDGDRYGYWAGSDGSRYAHRNVWEHENGPVPEGLLVDHTCHNRACVELTHLRLATRAQNAQNRAGATSVSRTGVRGVRLMPDGTYLAHVKSGDRRFARRYPTESEATEVAIKVRKHWFGDYAGGD